MKFLALAGFALCVGHPSAQGMDGGEVTRDVVLLRAEPLSLAQGGPRYRLHTEPEVLRVEFALINKTPGELVYDQEVVRTLTVTARHTDGAQIPVVTRWEEGVILPDERGRSAPSYVNGPVTLGPRITPSWVVAVSRQDGKPFTAGDYTVSVTTPSIAAIVRKADGTAWVGRDLHGLWDLRFVVQPPSSADELKAQYRWAVRDAFARRDYEEALIVLTLLKAEDPSDLDAQLQEANALSLVGRYREAITRYEQLIPRLSNAAAFTFRTGLARSYLGAADEANARRVLLERGVPADTVGAEIESLRESFVPPAR